MMKTLKYLLPFIVLFSLKQLQAQISISLKAGASKAWQDYGPDVLLPDGAETHIYGLNTTLSAYYDLGKYLRVGIEPGYVRRGAACEPGFIGPFIGDTKLLLDYVQMPLMVSGKLPLMKERFELFAKLGYGPSVMMGAAREEIILNGDEPAQVRREDLSDFSQLNRWGHGAYGGIGMGLNLGPNQIFLECQGYASFRDANSFNVSKNRSININLGFQRYVW